MDADGNQATEDLIDALIERQINFLRERIDPECELLEILRSSGALSCKEMSIIKERSSSLERNSLLLDYILTNRGGNRLITSLQDAEQVHIANYLNANAEYKSTFGGEWPLTEYEISILDTNHECVANLLKLDDLLDLLLSTKVISRRQMDSVISKLTSYEKAETLLDIMQRRSLNNYKQTIGCLHQTKQSHIAELFDQGGDFAELRKIQMSGQLKTLIKDIFSELLSLVQYQELTQLLHRPQIATLTVTLSEKDYENCRKHFSGDIKLRAVLDFDPKLMSVREKYELKAIEKLRRQLRQMIPYGDGQIVRTGNQSEEMYYSEEEADLEAAMLSFKTGNKMETVPPANIGDNTGWWMARHLDSGQIGFMPRNRVVIDLTSEEQTVKTNMYDLPLEMLSIILQKSYLHWILNSPTRQSDEEVIRSLTSVDVCFYQRITRQRCRKSIWRYLKDFYERTTKSCTIVRNNRNYLLENIETSDELLASLLAFNCITNEQSRFIRRHRSNLNKNDRLLYLVKNFDETNVSNFVKCLRRTRQRTGARIIENGGDAIKIVVKTRDAHCSTSMETGLFHKKIEDLRNRDKPRSLQTNRHLSQLTEQGIDILNSHLDGESVVVWLWCHSQEALQHTQRLYNSNQLIDAFFENMELPTSMMVSVARKQFEKTVVVRLISSNFTQKIEKPGRDGVYGVAILQDRIHVLFGLRKIGSVIRIFEDQNPVQLLKKVELKGIDSPQDFVSSEKENCLYVSDGTKSCVWKIKREIDDQYRIIKWLTTDYKPSTMSVSSNGELLVSSYLSSNLRIYGFDAELVRSIQLPREIELPMHAVETSIGNLIIIHGWSETTDKGDPSWRVWKLSELTGDGQTVVRRFIPSNETQQLIAPSYLSLDSDDQVFVADLANDNVSHRVILLDSDLNWNRVFCATKLIEEAKPRDTLRLSFDEDKNQLIVFSYIGDGANVFTLSRN